MFTNDEIERIRDLLRELRRSDRDTQKKIRGQLRRMDFFITDFSHDGDGFTASDLDDLIDRGTIKIGD